MRSSVQIRAGVIGAGIMGARHARAYTQLSEVNFVGVYDPDRERASDTVLRNGGQVFHCLDGLLGAVDAVSIACPTSQHSETAIAALDRGVHVLIEKPMTASVQEAQKVLERSSRAPSTVVLVGHIERFNPTIAELRRRLVGQRVQSATLRRMSTFEQRSLDSDVIQDLMIHDIDLALDMFGDHVSQIDGLGMSVKTDKLDQAIGQWWIDTSLTVTLIASRVAGRKVRSIEVRTDNAWIVADLLARTVMMSRLSMSDQNGAAWPLPDVSQSEPEVVSLPACEPLRFELQHFVDCIMGRDRPVVDVVTGFRAIAYASAITECINRKRTADVDIQQAIAEIA